MTTNQEGRHSTARTISSTSRTYNEDWMEVFVAAGFTVGVWNERFLQWLNGQLGTSYTDLNTAQNAYAINEGFKKWSDIKIFSIVPDGAIVDRAGDYLCDRDGNYIINVAQS